MPQSLHNYCWGDVCPFGGKKISKADGHFNHRHVMDPQLILVVDLNLYCRDMCTNGWISNMGIIIGKIGKCEHKQIPLVSPRN